MLGIEAFVAVAAEELPPFELGERLIRLRHGIDLLELRFARDAAVFAATDEHVAQGSTSPVDWVRHQCRMSGHAAARSIATGAAADQLPASVAALDEGRIGFAHLALLAGSAHALEGAAGAAGFDEGPLLELALEHSVSRFAFDCTHARHVADAAAVLAEHVSAVECRRLELSRCEDGRAPAMSGFAPADWLMDWSSSVMGVAGAPGGDLEFAGAVPAATVQRLACDASIRRVLLGPDSAVIDVGRALRVTVSGPPAACRVPANSPFGRR